MKKLFFVLIAAVIAVVGLGTSESFACHITFHPDALEQVQVGETIRIEAIVTLEHGRCVLEDDDVQVELTEHINILSETGWEKINAREIHNTFELKVLNPGDAILRVYRECSKKGISEGFLTFQAVE